MKKLLLIASMLVIGGNVLFALPVLAQTNANTNANKPVTTYPGQEGGLTPIDSPVTGEARTLTALIARVIQYTLGLIAMVAIVVIILAGFRMIAGSGDEKQRTTAKRSITWAIVGLVLALLSFSIVSIVQSIIHP